MKKQMIKTSVAIVCAATVCAAEPPDLFSKMDSDRSGDLSHEEYLAHYMRVFEQLDKNGDRLLAPDEFHSKASFSRCDRDGDGKLSISEYTELYSGQFSRKDTDRSGGLSPSEMASGTVG